MHAVPTDPQDWFCTFFHGLALDFWRAVITPEMTAREVDFAVAALELPPGARVLDAPCGNGRHAIELAARGYSVTGVDISQEFLAEAIATAQQRGLPIDFRQGNLKTLGDLPEATRFDGAICLGNSFGYLTHADTLRWLRRLSDSLRPGARFLMDTGAAAEALLPHFEKTLDMEFGGIHMNVEHRYDVLTSRVVATYTFKQGDRVESHDMSQGVYTCGELIRLLRSVGLETERVVGAGEFGSNDLREFALGDSWLRLVAVKT